jgi:hypothetical protein
LNDNARVESSVGAGFKPAFFFDKDCENGQTTKSGDPFPSFSVRLPMAARSISRLISKANTPSSFAYRGIW